MGRVGKSLKRFQTSLSRHALVRVFTEAGKLQKPVSLATKGTHHGFEYFNGQGLSSFEGKICR